MIDSDVIKSEQGLRKLIEKNLRKDIHPGTKPSIDFIHKILEDAYNEGLSYDLTDLRPRVLSFANASTNQSLYCIKLVQTMKFEGKDEIESVDIPDDGQRLAMFDIEVFPNILAVGWKFEGEGDVVKMINPTPKELEQLFKLKLVGFNNRKYDNHILYGRYNGLSIEECYNLSRRIIVDNDRNALFGAAYGLSHADIYDFSSKKQSLKKFQVELGIPHKEWGGKWDKPVKDEDIPKLMEYLDNDVMATEAAFNDRKQDYVARQILADISGLRINDTTQKHTAKIIFGEDLKNDKHKSQFIYTDLATGKRWQGVRENREIEADPVTFEGYSYSFGKSSYKDDEPSEGGYVYTEPGIHEDVAVLDVTSMHPNSIIQLELFGSYTEKFRALLDVRVAIKRGDYATARSAFNGRLAGYLDDEANAEALSYALKIVINIVYGLTCASFDNPFRDKRNKDNIVAKRGALFMMDVKEFVQSRGFDPIHIKTDSVKIPLGEKGVKYRGIIEEVMEFAEKYGYEFEHEETYDRIALINKAVYVARTADGRTPAHWEAVGAQFQHPYVFKTLFTGEPVEFSDITESKSVTTALYLDYKASKAEEVDFETARFIGKTGVFVPVQEGSGGGVLVREKEVDGALKAYSVAGTSGYFWRDAEIVDGEDLWEAIDFDYYNELIDEARNAISQFGDVDWFIGNNTQGEN